MSFLYIMHITYIRLFFCILSTFIFLPSCVKHTDQSTTRPTVEVKFTQSRYQLYRHGQPYYIKGVAGTAHLYKAATYGANSVRTWDTRHAREILDEAHQLGLTVTLGLEVGREHWGEDFDYWDDAAVKEKIEELRQIVLQYKDHPALLMWGVGNEVDLFGGDHYIVLRTIDKIARMIKNTDPNHPVMTALSHGPHLNKRGIMHLLSPHVDIIGVNAFSNLPQVYHDIRHVLGWRKAYFFSEWGAPGSWDARSTEWGAPYENSSARKAQYTQYYTELMQQDTTHCLGGYAFYWGQKYERTHTFMNLFAEDQLETEAVQVLQTYWQGEASDNRAPRIDSLLIYGTTDVRNTYLRSGEHYQAEVMAQDTDHDNLQYCWEIRHEGYSNFEPGYFYYTYDHLLETINENTLHFKAPDQEGAYRLFVYVYDGQGHVATQNLPFYVIPLL